jgi:hypothetical protein
MTSIRRLRDTIPGMRVAVALVAVGAVFAACGDDPAATPPRDGGVEPSDGGPEADAAVVPRGARVLGVDVAPNSVAYPNGVTLARDAGVSSTNARFAWNEIETPADGGTQIANPGLHVVNLVLDANRTDLALAIDAIDIGGSLAPTDLQARAWDDPEVATRYQRVLDYAFGQIPDAKITTLFVGADVDVALGDDGAAYASFATFLGRVAGYARTTRSPAPRVGVVVTAAGIDAKKDRLAPIWANGDVVGVAYVAVDATARALPVAAVAADFDRVVAAVPAGQPIHFREVGFPTAAESGGGEAAQADFVRAAFAAWDVHAGRVTHLTFFELEDAPEATAAAFAARAGRPSDAIFLAMRKSLGIARKPAFDAVREQARARGF